LHDTDPNGDLAFFLVVKNIGALPGFNVTLDITSLDEAIATVLNRRMIRPKALEDGTDVILPGETFRFIIPIDDALKNTLRASPLLSFNGSLSYTSGGTEQFETKFKVELDFSSDAPPNGKYLHSIIGAS